MMSTPNHDTELLAPLARQEARDRAAAAVQLEQEETILARLLREPEAIAQAWDDNAIDLTGNEVAVALLMDDAAGDAALGKAVRQIVRIALARSAADAREDNERARQRRLVEDFAAYEARRSRVTA